MCVPWKKQFGQCYMNKIPNCHAIEKYCKQKGAVSERRLIQLTYENALSRLVCNQILCVSSSSSKLKFLIQAPVSLSQDLSEVTFHRGTNVKIRNS